MKSNNAAISKERLKPPPTLAYEERCQAADDFMEMDISYQIA